MSHTGIRMYFLLTKENHMKNIWIQHGCIYRPYEFVVFLNKQDAVNFLHIFQPFDLPTGGFLIGASLGLTIVLFVISYKDQKREDNDHIQILTMLLFYYAKTFTEQSESRVVGICRRTAAGGFIIISSWLFVMLIVGNEYKGFMTSSMTTSPIDQVPESMMDLVMNSTVPYFTTSKHWYQGQTYSTLKDMVLADMIYSGEENYMQKFLLTFRHFLALLRADEVEIILNITNKLPVESEFGIMSQEKWIKFALISVEEDMDLFVGIMRKLTDYVIIPNNKISPFVSRVPWYGKRNNFIKLAIVGIARLVQSGIYDLWDKQFKQARLINNLRKVDIMSNLTQQNYFAFVVLTKSKVSNQLFDSSPINLKTVDIVFMACGAVAGLSVVIFILENLCHKLWIRATPVLLFDFLE